MRHFSVLLHETIDSLDIKEDGIYIDATLGRAGHSSEVLKKLKTGKLYCFDQDAQAIAESTDKLKAISNNFEIIKSNFRNIKEELEKRNVTNIDGIIYDLGLSSPQLDDAERGFSFHQDSKLDMRMDQDQKLSAYDVVNSYTKHELANLIKNYGEEKFANNIAKRIVEEREIKPIETTLQLVEVIKTGIPMKFHSDKHPARKTFQAIRMEVNDELNSIKESITDALEMLNSGSTAAVISFHSLEDRIVKTIFKKLTTPTKDFNSPLPDVDDTRFKLVNKKPILATGEELDQNNRSRSAKLRIIKRR